MLHAVPTIEFDVDLADGGILHGYDTHPGEPDRRTVVWFHGTPNIGAPPTPLAVDSERLGLRWLSYDRPGYGGSTARPDRSVATAAPDVQALADAAGADRFALVSHSGGGPHALATAALLPHRVTAVVAVSTLAPYDAHGLDWFAGMGPNGTATLRAAASGRKAKEAYEAAQPEDAEVDFEPLDWQALGGPWGWFGSVVGPALARGPAPLIDDDLAYVAPWGADPGAITVPVLLLHGAADRIAPAGHSRWLAARIPQAELRIIPDAGHISVLEHAVPALEWLARTS